MYLWASFLWVWWPIDQWHIEIRFLIWLTHIWNFKVFCVVNYIMNATTYTGASTIIDNIGWLWIFDQFWMIFFAPLVVFEDMKSRRILYPWTCIFAKKIFLHFYTHGLLIALPFVPLLFYINNLISSVWFV